jgi:CheY-like chemotaxis protein
MHAEGVVKQPQTVSAGDNMEKLKILVVEHDKGTQALYQHGLDENLFERRFADTGEGALAAYEDSRPDIIILDIGLPDIDGISILRKIREEKKDALTTIIVAGSLSGRDTVEKSINIGIDGFIVKPFHHRKISENIMNCHNRHSSTNTAFDSDTLNEMIKHNWSHLDTIEGDLRKIDLSVGMEIRINIQGIDSKLKSFITGIHHGQYILIQCPGMAAIEPILFTGNVVHVVYIYLGNLYSFKSYILNSISVPSKLIFLSYPESVEVYRLRRNRRANCFLNASIRSADGEIEYTGVVLDISLGGCRFVTIPNAGISRLIQVQDEIKITLEVTGSIDPLLLSGELRSITQDSRRISMGIMFVELGNTARKTIDHYIKTVMNLSQDRIEHFATDQ